MAGTRFRFANAILLTVVLGVPSVVAWAAEPLVDRPVVWYEADRTPIAEPAERDPNLLWDGPRESVRGPVKRFLDPVRWLRSAGGDGGGGQAQNVNTLGEVPASTWFNHRLGMFPLTPQEVAKGPGTGKGPSLEGPWTVISAKTEGVTPGFNIRDAAGSVWVIKFDHPSAPNAGTAAGVISNRIYYGAGYNVPDDVVVYFERDRLHLGEGVRLKLPDGSKRSMTVEDLEAVLDTVASDDGQWRALASRFLSGKPLGPFPNDGRRKDDPNDRVRHENRRELRGSKVFAAWVNHFDLKQHNSLDMFVPLEDSGEGEAEGLGYVRHHWIDFASTLGNGASGPEPSYGWEYSFDLPATTGRLFSLGIHDDAWRHVERPAGLPEVGYFGSDPWDPLEFKSLVPNAMFANFNHLDGYWGAKIVTAFTDEHIRAIVEQGRYESPLATEYVARILRERRDMIGRAYFDLVAPLEYWSHQGANVAWRDLGVERGLYPGPSRYRFRIAVVDANRHAQFRGDWVETDILRAPVRGAWDKVPAASHPFLTVEVQVDRGEGWSGSVSAYFSRRENRLVAIDR